MTSVILNKSVFQKTLTAFHEKYNLAGSEATFVTEPSGEAFRLTAMQKEGGSQVQAFGACSVEGEPVSVAFDLVDLGKAIEDAFSGSDGDATPATTTLTLLIGDGIWVKDPTPIGDDGQ